MSKVIATLFILLVTTNCCVVEILCGESILNSTRQLFAIPKIRKFERNRGFEFEFMPVSSKIEEDYEAIPFTSTFHWDMNQPYFLYGDGCQLQLTINIIHFQKVPSHNFVTLCLFRDNGSIAATCVPGSKVNILGNSFDPSLHFDKKQPVTGFVLGEYNSLVHGFIIKRYFYGSIRIYDPRPHHHVVFFVEPIHSLSFYHPDLIHFKKEPGINAFVFEYVRHEGDSTTSDSTIDIPLSFEGKMNESLATRAHDLSGRVKIKNGTSPTNIFDIRNDNFSVCEVCIWMQPNFGEKFGLGGGISTGVSVLYTIWSFVQLIFQNIDFNGDNSPDNIQLLVKHLSVTDKVKIGSSTSNQSSTTSSPKIPRSRRNSNSDEENEEMEESYGNETMTLNPKEAYDLIRKQLVKHFKNWKCCAIVGYVYHNLAPKLSYSTQGGICSKSHNVGLITGFIHTHKVSESDIFRSTMHTLGHLFGAREDDMAEPNCKVDMVNTPNIFNPPLMDSFHKIDVGMRPNSMRYSPCAKLDITSFLTSPNAACLRTGPKVVERCGNGIVEPGEECDCGLPWQCHSDEMEKPSCCGESDTMVRCRKIGSSRYQTDAHCHRPFTW